MGTTKKKPATLEKRIKSIPKMGAEKEVLKHIIFDLWIKGYSQMFIRDSLHDHGHSVSIGTISNYIRSFLQDYKDERIQELEEQRQAELMKLDKLEQTYWESWERSIGLITTRTMGGWESGIDNSQLPPGIKGLTLDQDRNTIVKGNTARANANKRNKKYVTYSESMSLGDVRFLMGIERVIDKRCKLLGLDAPIVIEDKTKTRITRKINIAVYNGKSS